MADARNKHVVMLTKTRDADLLEVVKVSGKDAERLIANGLAREPHPGEVKAASES